MSLAQKISASVEPRIWAASYDPKRDTFRVAMEDGQIFLLQRPIPEDDQSEVLDVHIECLAESLQVKINELIVD